MDDKINSVEKKAELSRKKLEKKVLEQTEVITKHIDSKLSEFNIQQTENLKECLLLNFLFLLDVHIFVKRW